MRELTSSKENDTLQNAVNGAIDALASLATAAETDADYIRHIILFQAQPKNQKVTVAALKEGWDCSIVYAAARWSATLVSQPALAAHVAIMQI